MKENKKTTIALFDFDGTLTKHDSLLPFLKYISSSSVYYFNLLLVSPILLSYLLKIIPAQQAKEKLLSKFISGMHSKDLTEKSKYFTKEIIPKILRNETLERLRWHQENGDICILVSASLDIYLDQWAKNEGFDYCLSTRLHIDSSGIVSGKIEGKNCQGAEKARRIRELNFSSADYIYGYGNSNGDREMLALCRHSWVIKRDTFKGS